MNDSVIFDEAIRSWASAACEQWEYEQLPDSWLSDVQERLPVGLRLTLGRGLATGAIKVVGGFKFRLPDLPEEKGPYAWLGKSATGVPAVHWEYYVQVAEYLRLRETAGNRVVSFEDDLMDITVYEEGTLLLACEVKERSEQLAAIFQ